MSSGRVALLALAGLLFACEGNKPKTPVERGARTFTRLCVGCHGPDGRGVQRPGFNVPPRNLTDPDFQRRISDADIERSIRQGKGQMPAFGPLLPEQDVDELIAFIRTLPARAHSGPR